MESETLNLSPSFDELYRYILHPGTEVLSDIVRLGNWARDGGDPDFQLGAVDTGLRGENLEDFLRRGRGYLAGRQNLA